MTIALFYNARCPLCVGQAKRTARLDWLGRVVLRTDDSPLGAVPVGEIVVVEKRSRRAFTGVYATRKVYDLETWVKRCVGFSIGCSFS